MNDPIIAAFKAEFDRFFTMLEKQIDICPEELWAKKVGGWPFWQQQLHSLACTFIYARPEGQAFEGVAYKPAVIMLAEEPDFTPAKDDLRRLAAEAKAAAHDYMDGLTAADLPGRHRLMCDTMKKDMTHQSALMALPRHICYHLGSCDAALRDLGIPGVY
ncbi:MAG: hypothetical protein LBV79_03535 [Candidatus Adiutrix sp.]|jgi:hypothetical protein|nr:hypothetical protein [Candidatus Adiutrix sp.]